MRQNGEILSFPHLRSHDTIFFDDHVRRKRTQVTKRHVGVGREIKVSALELKWLAWGQKSGWEEIA
jgi:hypothetical protein